jgi:photosystem II stability/assembly factor-like uncharacterized protein
MSPILSRVFPYWLIAAVLLFSVCSATLRAETWVVVPSGEGDNLRSVFMVNSKYGYATGENGTFIRTTNGGLTWTQQRLTVTFNKSVNGAAVYDTSSFSTAVGDNGEVLMMYPGTTSWGTVAAPQEDVYGVCYRADSVPTTMYCGTNGFIGQTQIHSHTFTVFDDYGYPLYDTTEFFVDPKQIQSPSNSTLRAIAFGVTNGYIVGDSGTVLVSTNRGSVWRKSTVGSQSLQALAVLDLGRVIAVGTDGTIIRTTNTGATWQSISPPGLKIDLHGVAFADATRGVVVGDGGCILQTTDGGTTWVRMGVNTVKNLHGVHAMSAVVGSYWIAVGDSGAVVVNLYGGIPVSFTSDKNTVAIGDVAVGAKRSDNVSFTNNSTESYVTVQMTSPDPRVTLSPSYLILDPGATGRIRVTFGPTDTGAVSVKLLFMSDTGWTTDTIHVTGRGTAPYARLSGNALAIDSAREGNAAQVTVWSTGNVPLTATIAFVSDTNVDVACGATTQPGDSMLVTAVVKHTLYRPIDAIAVLQTNAYQRKPDTIHITAAAVERVSVPEDLAVTAFTGASYPNPLLAGASGTLLITSPTATACVLRITDERGAIVREINLGVVQGTRSVDWSLPTLARGAYMLQVLTPTGQAAGVRAAVR